MNLREFQRQIEDGITAPPVCKRSAPRLRNAAGLIKPNSRMSAFERLEIYRQSYWARLLDSLEEDFPGLQVVLGKRAFRRLSEAYLAHSPSRSFTLRDLGSRLVPFLQKHPAYAGSNPELALDMARLEWAHIEAFDSAAEPPIGPEDLIELDAGLKLRLQPHLRLLELRHPVDDWLIRIQSGLAKRKRTLLRPSEVTFLAVHRAGEGVYYRSLAPGEFRILSAFQRGQTLQEVLKACKNHEAGLLEAWFASWSRSGWLCGSAGARLEESR